MVEYVRVRRPRVARREPFGLADGTHTNGEPRDRSQIADHRAAPVSVHRRITHRTIVTGTGAVRTTRSATLPNQVRDTPDRVWLPITIRSTSRRSAYSTISRSGRPKTVSVRISRSRFAAKSLAVSSIAADRFVTGSYQSSQLSSETVPGGAPLPANGLSNSNSPTSRSGRRREAPRRRPRGGLRARPPAPSPRAGTPRTGLERSGSQSSVSARWYIVAIIRIFLLRSR